MNSQYTVDYFIEKFRKIPSRKWCRWNLHTDDGRACALGHCGMTSCFKPTREARALMRLFKPFGLSVPGINNNFGANQFKQRTPRARILAALQEIKSKSHLSELSKEVGK